ncbi:MAG: helix-turn-helix domain-containing protein [Pseudomonadota bacterium]
MSRSENPISISYSRIVPLLDQASAAGLDVEGLLRSVDLIDQGDGGARPSHISLADYYRLQNRLAVLFGDETLHVSSRQLLPGSTDFVLKNTGGCANLYEVMGAIAKSYNLLHGGEYNFVVKRRSSVEYVIDDQRFPYAVQHNQEFIYFSIECVLIFLHCLLNCVSQNAASSISMLHIRRPSPGGDCSHLGYWAAPIKFGAQKYKVVFDRADALRDIDIASSKNLTANAVYQKIIETVAGRNAGQGGSRSAESLVRDALMRGVVEQTDVAAQMGVSVATLRRRLAAEGVLFRDLRRDVLNETAKRLLKDDRSVAEVSERLGFSEFRAFNRAFKDWNGETPAAYLKRASGHAR